MPKAIMTKATKATKATEVLIEDVRKVIELPKVEDIEETKGVETEEPKEPEVEKTKELVVEVDYSKLSVLEHYKGLLGQLEDVEVDLARFNDRKVKVCAQRARNMLLTCKKMCDALRRRLLLESKSIPVKHRKSKESEVESTKTEIKIDKE